MNKAIKITKISLLITFTLIVLYDIIIVVFAGEEATVSNVTLWAGIRLAFVPYAWGVMTSHFFLGKIGRALFGLGKWRFFVWIPISISALIMAFVPSALQLWLSSNLYAPLIAGELVGLYWAQERPKI